MRTSEWLTVGFFAYLIAAAVATGAPRHRIARLLVLSVVCSVPAITFAQAQSAPVLRILRDWLPGLYLLLGYWAAGHTSGASRGALERKLQRVDTAVFRLAGPFIARGPRLVLELVELAYLLYYPLVPGGLVLLYALGLRAESDAYWTAVLLAAFASCAVLPVATTRPPRALGCEMWIERRSVALRRFNYAVLRHGSIQLNTCPSAHAATSAAVAVFLLPLGWPSIPFVVVAGGIGLGAVVGRYHYMVDVVAGALVGVLAGLVARV